VHLGLSSPPATYRESTLADEPLNEAWRAALFTRGVQTIPGRIYVGMSHGDEELKVALAAMEDGASAGCCEHTVRQREPKCLADSASHVLACVDSFRGHHRAPHVKASH
jgi:hypothetical protein